MTKTKITIEYDINEAVCVYDCEHMIKTILEKVEYSILAGMKRNVLRDTDGAKIGTVTIEKTSEKTKYGYK